MSSGTMRRVVVCILVILLPLATCRAGERSSKDYPAATLSIAAEAINGIEDLYGADVDVSYDRRGGKLIVLATADQHEAIAAMVDPLDDLPGNIRVSIEIREGVQVTQSGFTIRDAADSRSDEEDAASKKTRRRMTQQTLRIPDGGDALFMVSPNVPNVGWLMSFGIQHGDFGDEVVSTGIGAFLRMHARVIGDGAIIAIRMVPELRDPAAPLRRGLAFDRLAKEYKVEDGQMVLLSGEETRSEFYRKFLVGVDRRGRWRQLNIRVTSSVDDAGEGAPIMRPVPDAADQGSSKSQIRGK